MTSKSGKNEKEKRSKKLGSDRVLSRGGRDVSPATVTRAVVPHHGGISKQLQTRTSVNSVSKREEEGYKVQGDGIKISKEAGNNDHHRIGGPNRAQENDRKGK